MVAPVIVGAAISAAGSLLGGLFNRRRDDTSTEVDYVKMARNAMKAGFNPLTAMRNGGSAGFVNTHHPALSSFSGFGAAFQTIGDAMMSFDPRADERAALEDRLMMAQIASLDVGTERSRKLMAFDVPSAAGSTRDGMDGRPLDMQALAAGDRSPKSGKLSVTNPLPVGSNLEVNPYLIDAEQWETRYGDLVQEVGGAINVLSDVAWNFNRGMNFATGWAPRAPGGKPVKSDDWAAPAVKAVKDWFKPWADLK